MKTEGALEGPINIQVKLSRKWWRGKSPFASQPHLNVDRP